MTVIQDLQASHRQQETSKTRVIQRTFNGFQKVYFWCILVERQAEFGEPVTHGLGKTVLHTCSDLLKPVQTCSHLFTPLYTCSHLFIPVHTSVTTLFAQWQFLIEFFPWESCYFFDLTSYLAEIAYFCSLNRGLVRCTACVAVSKYKCRSLQQPILQ